MSDDMSAKIAVLESQHQDFKTIMKEQSDILKDGFSGLKDILDKIDRRVLTLEIEHPNTQKKIEDIQSEIEDSSSLIRANSSRIDAAADKLNGFMWAIRGMLGTSALAVGSVLYKWIW